MGAEIIDRLARKVGPNLYEWLTVEICPGQASNLAKLKAVKRLKKSEVVQLSLEILFTQYSPDEIERLIRARRE